MTDEKLPTTDQIANALVELDGAEQVLEQRRRECQEANRLECDALNRLNQAQKHVAELLAARAKSAPRGSDWARKQVPQFPVPA